MKKLVKSGVIVFLTVMTVLAFMGCPQEVDKVVPLNADTGLKSLALNSVVADTIGAGTPLSEWQDPAFDPIGMEVTHLFVTDLADLTGATVIAEPNFAKAVVRYVVGAPDERPATEFKESGVFDFADEDFLFIQVTAENRKEQAYYKVQIHLTNAESRINKFRIGGRAVPGFSSAAPAADVESVTLVAHSLDFGENVDAAVEIGTYSQGATFEIAHVKAGSADAPAFGNTATFVMDDGDKIYVKVTSSDGQSVSYFGASVAVVRIIDITLGGMNGVDVGAGLMLEDASALPDRTYSLSRELATDATFEIRKAEAVTVQYAMVAPDATPAAADYETWALNQTETFEPGTVLWIKAVTVGFPDRFIKYNLDIKWNTFALTSVVFGTVEADPIGTGGTGVNVAAAARGTIGIIQSGGTAGKLIVATPEADRGITITGYAMGTGNTPTWVEDNIATGYTSTVNAADGMFLWVRVQSEAGSTYYYRMTFNVLSSDPALAGITVGGTPVPETDMGTPQATWNGAGLVAGKAIITAAQATAGVEIEAEKEAAGSTLSYAYTATDVEPTFGESATLEGPLAAGGFIWIRSLAEDEIVIAIYKLAVVIQSNDATVSAVTVNAVAVDVEDDEKMPTPAGAYDDADEIIYNFGPTAPTTIDVVATATESHATVTYGLSDSSTEEPETWESSGTFASGTFASGDYFAVKVVAENGITTNYYKWRVSYGSDTAALAVTDGLVITGVRASAYGTPAGTWNDEDIVSGAISLNNTQTANGKSVVINVDNANITAVAISTNNTNNDTQAPTQWNTLTRDEDVPTMWAGTLSGTALANNRRLYIRLTAEDTVTNTFYKVLVSSGATATLTNITIDGVAVPAASRGTPAGAWNASDLRAGVFITAVKPAMTVVPTWGAGGTNDVTYATTTAFPAATEPAWGASADLTGIAAGTYIWVKTVNGNYSNVYVIQVSPEPFSLTIGGKAVAWGSVGTSWATGTLAVTGMGEVVLDQAALDNVAASVTVSPDLVGATAVLAKYAIPQRAQSANIAIGDFAGATASLAAGAFKEKDIVQVKYTAPGATDPVYYAINIRRAMNVPYVTRGAIDMEVGTAAETAWATAPTLPLDRVYFTDSAGWGNVADYNAATPSTIKVLWNEDGLYYFANVIDATRSIGADHNCDNIEFFVSENYTLGATGNWNNVGGQYRVGRGGAISGDNTGRVTTVVTDTDTGYTIKTRIAWGTAAGTVEGWADGQLVGIDIQLAYSRTVGSRDACIMWNNFIAGSYQQKGRTGLAYLKR